MEEAVLAYRTAAESSPSLGTKTPSIKAIADAHQVPYTSLRHHLAGVTSIAQFNTEKRLLHPKEEAVVVGALLQLAQEQVNTILHLQLGDTFEVGKAYPSHLLEWLHDQLHVYHPHSLDEKCANGADEVLIGWWYDTLEELFEKYQFLPTHIFAMDETGLMLGVADSGQVIRPSKKKIQHLRRDENRELASIIKTICADSTKLKLTIIFKGVNLQK
ncbi:hypothetical protein FRB99_003936 [Tulasnella sp. 403]|nr:hypothetical protein FRB99_003936 [Tulasnella sp. 403]